MKELIKEYLETIKNIQGCNEVGLIPYELNSERVRLHRLIADYLGLKNESEYLRLKEIFSNMDLICSIYSDCEEWKLRDSTDIALMTNNLFYFLSSREAVLFIEGKVSNLKQLHCIQNHIKEIEK
ncbi:MAG: hypothetical protein II837_16095 [Treponema sp.]|nr:hypothetical protein [Treponema sp.]